MHVSRQLGPFPGGGCGSCARCGINQVHNGRSVQTFIRLTVLVCARSIPPFLLSVDGNESQFLEQVGLVDDRIVGNESVLGHVSLGHIQLTLVRAASRGDPHGPGTNQMGRSRHPGRMVSTRSHESRLRKDRRIWRGTIVV